MKKVKYTIEELRELATRSYPSALKEVLSNKYKVDGFDGYLMLDNLNNDGTVPQLFYDGKWRQDNINIIKDNILYTLMNSDGLTFGRFGTVEEAMKNIKELKDNTRLNGYNIVANWETAEAIELPITKENIHLYYEFMSDEDLEKLDWGVFWNSGTKSGVFLNRYSKIGNLLDIPFNQLAEFAEVKHRNFALPVFPETGYDDTSKKDFSFNTPIGLFVFGVKDTLKPIDEYIAEIKASKEYQEYEQPQKNNINDDRLIDIAHDIDPDLFNKYTDETLSQQLSGTISSIQIDETMDVEKERADLERKVNSEQSQDIQQL